MLYYYNIYSLYLAYPLYYSPHHTPYPPPIFPLSTLGLNDNAFTGTLPTTLGQLTALTALFIGTNQFSGAVPNAFCGLAKNLDFELEAAGVSCYPQCMAPGSAFTTVVPGVGAGAVPVCGSGSGTGSGTGTPVLAPTQKPTTRRPTKTPSKPSSPTSPPAPSKPNKPSSSSTNTRTSSPSHSGEGNPREAGSGSGSETYSPTPTGSASGGSGSGAGSGAGAGAGGVKSPTRSPTRGGLAGLRTSSR